MYEYANIFKRCLELREGQWEEVLDGFHDVGLFLTIHHDLHVLMVALL